MGTDFVFMKVTLRVDEGIDPYKTKNPCKLMQTMREGDILPYKTETL